VDGVVLTFHLAGINNQNFIMRDEQTGSYWQQISGAALSGPMAGKHLTLVPSDELTFALWKTEQPRGEVLRDLRQYAKEYAPRDWDVKSTPVVISFKQPGIGQRDIMLGVRAFGASRAFPFETVLQQKVVKDHVGSEPVLLVVGPDDKSVRVFRDRIPGVEGAPDFYRLVDKPVSDAALLMDSTTGSRWNFEGCAVDGPAKGRCLERVDVIKDYWFDWRNYNPQTTVYAGAPRERAPLAR
jgi:hypothetical protein